MKVGLVSSTVHKSIKGTFTDHFSKCSFSTNELQQHIYEYHVIDLYRSKYQHEFRGHSGPFWDVFIYTTILYRLIPIFLPHSVLQIEVTHKFGSCTSSIDRLAEVSVTT